MSKRGNHRTTKTQQAERQAKAIELTREGMQPGEIAQQVGASRVTIWRDLEKLRLNYHALSKENFAEYVQVQIQLLTTAVEEVWEGNLPPEAGNAIRRMMDSIARLTGSNAPARTITAHVSAEVDPQTLKGYRRFVFETRGLDQESLQKVYEFARSLPRPVAEPAGPPASSPLWLEEQCDS